jgi:dimethylhistidine N-methyltransferase
MLYSDHSARLNPDSFSASDAEFAEAILAGLSAPQKSLPCRYFYDDRGSRLFEEITRLPEYYPTRTERSVLTTYAAEIANGDGDGSVLVEFGSGSSRKTEVLLAAMPRVAAYVPVDVSAAALREAKARLKARFPRLNVQPVLGDFSSKLELPANLRPRRKLGFFPGSTIGNFERREAIALLSDFRRLLSPEIRLIIGVDTVKDPCILLAAYNDSAGVTAAFNLNLLDRINHTFGHAFDRDAFRHEAIYDAAHSRIEMHLVSRRDQTVNLFGRVFRFRLGETIHTENSHKYTIAGFRQLAGIAGWQPRRVWQDAGAMFSVHELAAD